MAAIELARFTDVLERYQGEMDDATYWRYRGGRVPKLLAWLANRADLAQALADDAAELATKTVGVELIVAGEDTEQEEPK